MSSFTSKFFYVAASTLVALFVADPAAAEYRAYELKIDNAETNKSYTVISFLDNLQYPKYHPLNKGETIQYVDSWMCWDNSSNFKKACPKPERNIASVRDSNKTTAKTPPKDAGP